MLQSIAIRLCDILVALCATVALAVPMILIAVALRLSDGGPALFRQRRVGKGGRPFEIYKFRSMRVDGSGAGTGVARAGEAVEVARLRFQRTERGDPRITPLGAILRPSHLDELPQLLNILRGDMSLVGVRPDTPVQEGDYSPEYWVLRHRFRPGLTGPAQLRSDPVDFEQRGAEELKWLQGRSFTLYLSILWRTAAKVVRRSSF